MTYSTAYSSYVIHYGPIVFACRLAVGGLFIVGGLIKLLDISLFQSALANYCFLSARLIDVLSWIVPIVELSLGVALIANIVQPWTGIAVVGVLGLLTIAVTAGLLYGAIGKSCGCLGKLSAPISWKLVCRNLALVGVALIACERLRCWRVLALFPFWEF